MNIDDLNYIENVDFSNNSETNSIAGGVYPFRNIYDPDILEQILEDEHLLKEVFPGDKPEKTTDGSGSKYERVYGAQTTDDEIARLTKIK
ncbi:MAG: hypothetical protein QNJ63_11050 [Calothrix sp. MO_192.B10]|nr:hypothetical protein [Calothrix sp. MO_192.B10]